VGANKQLYEIWILRRDADHIKSGEFEKFEEACEEWKKLKESWHSCIKEQKPFELHKPIVTAFDPGLISEIRIVTFVAKESANSIDNPYHKEMQQRGLSEALNKYSKTGYDLLDGGYKAD
jgi:hypothetical protein